MDFKSCMSFLTSMVQAMHTAHMVPFSTLNNVSTMILYLKPIIWWYPFLESPRYLCTQLPSLHVTCPCIEECYIPITYRYSSPTFAVTLVTFIKVLCNNNTIHISKIVQQCMTNAININCNSKYSCCMTPR